MPGCRNACFSQRRPIFPRYSSTYPTFAPAQIIDGIEFRFGPVFTSLITGRLTREQELNDKRVLADALTTIEGVAILWRHFWACSTGSMAPIG